MVLALFAIPVVAYSMKPEAPKDVAQAEIDSITEKVGLLMDIPAESPTIASISDASKLRGQAFFAKAQNGDKVLIFNAAQKAVLYRPATNKIIEVALYKPPINTPQEEVAGTSTSIAPSPFPTQRPFSLQDLIGDNKQSVAPTSSPTQIPFQPTFAPQSVTTSPTP
ncbi:MAG: hypothetical protein KBB16_03570 [Candidatus Pacebacteria bacterium]|nr:hypothetical protein [Candidatus Paceibacterota bacterium]